MESATPAETIPRSKIYSSGSVLPTESPRRAQSFPSLTEDIRFFATATTDICGWFFELSRQISDDSLNSELSEPVTLDIFQIEGCDRL